jgi:hypothetical protein
MKTLRLFILLFASLTATGCASQAIERAPAPLIVHLRELAGPSAIACGASPLYGVSAPMQWQKHVVRCAEGAIRQRKPFWAAFQAMGDDSAIWESAVQTQSGALIYNTYDSDIYGGSRHVVVPSSDDSSCKAIEFGGGWSGIVACRPGPQLIQAEPAS